MKKTKKILSLVLAMVLGMSTSVFAESEKQYTFEEARTYLLNYCGTEINEFGKTITETYQFESDDALDRNARYIVTHGVAAFHEKLNNEIAAYIEKEEHSVIVPRETSPMSINKIVPSTDGTHKVSGTTYGLASFKTLGTVTYLAHLNYSVVVKKGKIVRFGTSPTFNITDMSGGGSWGSVTINQNLYDYTADATAKYIVKKSVKVHGVEVTYETDTEVFGVAALLK